MSKQHIDFKKAEFFKCIGLKEQLDHFTFPHSVLGHGCIVGRSNVGKSSLINHLFNNENLAKISSTPGKTQTLNFFLVDEKLLLVDLPGYGFASTSKIKKGEWGELIDDYFTSSPPDFVLMLIDICIPLSSSDKEMCNYIAAKNIPVIVLYTKCDKIAKTKLDHVHKKLEEDLLKETTLSSFSSLCYSIKGPKCRQTLIALISKFL